MKLASAAAALAATFVITAAWPVVAHATSIDGPLQCNVSGHDFIADLMQQQLIEARPMRVESNSINAFSPASGAKLTAYGFSVFAVVGFEKNDPMFRTGDGDPVANSAYGAVVWGGEEKVRDAVKRAGSPAIVKHVGPFVEAIFCKRS